MWKTAWKTELYKSSVNCAIQLSFNTSTSLPCPIILRKCVYQAHKYISKQRDIACKLSSYKLFVRPFFYPKIKYISVRRKGHFPGSYQVTKNSFYKNILFPWNSVFVRISNFKKYNFLKLCQQVFSQKISKKNSLPELNKGTTKSKASFNNIATGMSEGQMPVNEINKTGEGECIQVDDDDFDQSDLSIVFEKVDDVEILSEACSSRSHSQLLQNIQTFPLLNTISTPQVVTLEDEVVGCSNDSVKDHQKRVHLNELRQWEYTEFGKSFDLDGASKESKLCFTVMSYNVLSQDLLENHPYLYYDNDPITLSWEFRSKRLLEEIKEAAPDILCLQEVQDDQLVSFYIPRLRELGYDGIYKKRTGNKPDGVAIYYKTSTFSLVEHTSVEFMQPILPVLNRDNVALIAHFSSNLYPSLPHLCVATTHLLYNPRRTDVKLAQIQLLLAEIERMAYRGKGPLPSYYPIIITGDLNVTKRSNVYKLLVQGSICDVDVTDEMVDVLGITHNCQHLNILNRRKKSEFHSVDRVAELKLLQMYNSDHIKVLRRTNTSYDYPETEDKLHIPRNNGFLMHKFKLKSVYEHVNKKGREATTKQEQWITVDYIFYSCSSKENLPVEGNLKLVARYGLLSSDECTFYGPIPNMESPSDHFPLLCKFVLTP